MKPAVFTFYGRTAVALTAALLGLALVADLLFPPPLSRARDLSVVVESENGVMLRSFLSRDGMWRLPARVTDVDPRFLEMLKAYEDQRFGLHPGVDPLAVLRAAGQYLHHGRVVSGASTLTMQVARLLAPGRRGWDAKAVQALRALQLERRYSKDEILALYLTLAPYGGNLEGVRAAALAYLGKEPHRLTLSEAALLVALPQSPERQRLDRHPDRARQGRDKVLARLAERGVIAWAAAREAATEDLGLARRPLPLHAPHLAERLAASSPPGAVIRTTIDITLQTAVEDLARREARWFDDDANLAMIIVENATRKVRAHLGNANYWGSFGALDLTRAIRSPGSTLKPFIYGIAFDDLVAHPETLIDDRPTVFGDYAPRNFDRGFQGTISLRTALALSLNVPAVALLDEIGPGRFAARLSHVGVRLHFPSGLSTPALPLALGGVGITLEDLTALYVGLARDGGVAPLVFSDVPAASARPLFGPAAAWYVRDILKDSPLPDGFAMAKGLPRRVIAFKTGTSFGFRDAWAIGMSRDYTVAVWVGRPDGSARPGRFARNAAAPLLFHLYGLLPAEEGIPAPPPNDTILVGSYAGLPRALQHLVPGKKPFDESRSKFPLAIAFPPNGARVSLPAGDRGVLALRAEGGRGPYSWLINGLPLPADAAQGQRVFWTPDSQGFVRIAVIDRDGARAASLVRLVKE